MCLRGKPARVVETVSPSADLQQIELNGGSPSDTPQYAGLPDVRKVAMATDAVARQVATKAQSRMTTLS
jgi:hypothetical protein